jgi:hypothetical protein
MACPFYLLTITASRYALDVKASQVQGITDCGSLRNRPALCLGSARSPTTSSQISQSAPSTHSIVHLALIASLPLSHQSNVDMSFNEHNGSRGFEVSRGYCFH